MNIQWTTAALLSSVLIAGCGDRGTDNSKNFDENAPAATAGTATVDDREAVPDRLWFVCGVHRTLPIPLLYQTTVPRR